MHIRNLAAAAAAIAVAAPAAHAATLMPAAIQSTCLSSCFDQTHTYKQTISASSFSGPVSIGALNLDRALLGQNYQTSVFHVTFWTADGHQVGDFGRYMIGSLGSDVVTLKGSSFAYDPSLGNLTMKIELDGFSSAGGGGGFGFTPGAAPPQRIDFAPPGGDDPGLGFIPHGGVVSSDPVLLVSVPEPASWALMVLGFGGAGSVLRRRRVRPA